MMLGLALPFMPLAWQLVRGWGSTTPSSIQQSSLTGPSLTSSMFKPNTHIHIYILTNTCIHAYLITSLVAFLTLCVEFWNWCSDPSLGIENTTFPVATNPVEVKTNLAEVGTYSRYFIFYLASCSIVNTVIVTDKVSQLLQESTISWQKLSHSLYTKLV